jgi:hypothetical protein
MSVGSSGLASGGFTRSGITAAIEARLGSLAPRELLLRRVVRRWPFEVVEMPLALRLALAGQTRQTRSGRRFCRKASKFVFRNLHRRLGLPAHGVLHIARPDGDGDAEVVFDARNAQYLDIVRLPGRPAFDSETIALLDCLIGDSDVFYDIGANWGCHSLFIATRPDFAGSVHAFEPDPDRFEDLDSHVLQAELEHRVHCHRLALSDAEGEAPAGEMEAEQRLDDLGLPPPDVIKIDISKDQPEVLAGAYETLETRHPMIVIKTLYRPGDFETSLMPIELLEELGYSLYRPIWRSIEGYLGDTAPAEGAEGDLALLPFSANNRLAYASDFNALACHESRRDELATIFGD